MIRTLRPLLASALSLTLVGLALAEVHPVAPQLSSNPGATYTVYLDFSGFNYPGTWGNRTPGNVPAFGHTAGDVSGFTDQQQDTIRKTWAFTAQKYAGFNVNVTTVDPAAANLTDVQRKSFYDSSAHLMHTIIGETTFFGAAGGVSYVGVTQNAYPNPTGQATEFHTNWVFPAYTGSVKGMAEATAHENGHGLKLDHQTDQNTNAEYSLGGYSGNNQGGAGTYAPVMGAAYYTQRGAWRDGYHRSVDNQGVVTITPQNDVALLLSNDDMGPLLDDGIGHSIVTATSLAVDVNGAVLSGLAKGVIVPGSSSDPTPLGAYTQDFFKFTSGGGLMTLTQTDGNSFLQAGVADPGATLQGKLDIYNSGGVLVGSAIEDSSTLVRTFTGSLAAGDYYARVTSIGGFRSGYEPNAPYYTMGGYFLSGNIPQAVPEPASLAALGLGALALMRRRRKA